MGVVMVGKPVGVEPARCTDRICRLSAPSPFEHANAARASHLKHAVEGVNSYVNFNGPTFVYTRMEPSPITCFHRPIAGSTLARRS
jgi:hypothetical protein